jgi:hypothetical protein
MVRVGVKVYIPLDVLLIPGGFQVPSIPLSDVVGNIGANCPGQIGLTGVKVGIIIGLTVTVICNLVVLSIPATV